MGGVEEIQSNTHEEAAQGRQHGSVALFLLDVVQVGDICHATDVDGSVKHAHPEHKPQHHCEE